MNLYLWIDLAILAIPLALSFDGRVHYFRKWPAVLAATALVALVFIPWDVLKTSARVWGFNVRYVGELSFCGLPAGELLFFLVVPFSCIFIYEVVRAYFRERPVRVARWVWLAAAGALAALAIAFRDRVYTLTVLLAVAAVLALAALWQPDLLRSFHFWLAIALTYVPFLVFNGVLTAVPLVLYNDAEIWGIRVYTIPLEDFFYSFSLLGLAILLYQPLRRRWVRRHA
ncbi:MAG: lycopene cyclase domain-containing protein [Spirochaetales bacterium]|nr:lycopene cyclase domain-containing protein [Spirochaetales bacterium]